MEDATNITYFTLHITVTFTAHDRTGRALS
jgi:hypothetical protein